MLDVINITVHYGKAIALDGVSIHVAEGSVVSLIGANGAGKTTTLRAISGLIPLTSGEIRFHDRKIHGMSTSDIVKLGIAHIPQGRRLFPYLTVLSNLNLGASSRNDKNGIKEDMDNVFQHFPKLWERRNQKAGTLSGGEQQMLAIGRALMASPKLLLMDEPSLGLAPLLVAELVPVIRDINKKGISVLLVEQNVSLAMEVANMGYAMKVGKIVLEGDIEVFKTSDVVKECYLGK